GQPAHDGPPHPLPRHCAAADRLEVGVRPGGAASAPLRALGSIVLAVQAYDVQRLGGLHTGLYQLPYSLYPWSSHRPLIGPTQVFRFDVLPSPQAAGVLYTLSSARHGLCTRFWYRLTAQTPTGDGFLHAERLPA